MGYVLYGVNGSGSSLVEAALMELGADYRIHTVDGSKGEHRQTAYAALNPHRKLPTLITPEGETLTQTAAIVITLAERHPDADLLPPVASPQRALALRWMIFAVAELYPVVELLDHPERFAPDPATTSGVRDKALGLWKSRWLTVEQQLGDGPYLLGDRFCATDVFLAGLSRWDLPEDWRANIPKLERLAATVAGRPALRELWPRHFPSG